MALVSSKHAQRYDIPHEPGEWMRIRPLKASDQALIQRDFPTPVDREIALLQELIVEWSYEEPLSAAAIADIDLPTLAWLDGVVLPPLLAERTDEEKKDSSSGSNSGTPRRPRSPSLKSSNT